MQISLPAVPSTTAAPAVRGAAAWQLGQLLSAEVIGTAAPNYTRLRIGAREFTARNEMPLSVGQKLELRVVANTPSVVLQVRPPADAPTTNAVLARGMARSLPHQGSATDTLTLLRTLDRLVQPRDATAAQLARTVPTALREAAAALVQRLPHSSTLNSPAALRAAVLAAATPPEARAQAQPVTAPPGAASGEGRINAPFDALPQVQRQLPARLASGATSAPAATPPTPSAAGMEASDARVTTVARDAASGPATSVPAGPTGAAGREHGRGPGLDVDGLRGLIEGALARIQTQHLNSAAQQPGLPWHVGVELPVRHADSVDLWQFEFEGDARPAADEPAAATARLTLRLMLSETLTFSAHLASGPDGLHVRVTSSDPDYTAAIAASIDQLEQALRACDLPLADVGVGNVRASERSPVAPCALVDVAV